jgi:predicted GIY-YIG superfamily endonuclease
LSADPPSQFVYILECADGTLYVGHTGNLSARIDAHNEGRGARYTACRVPVRLVYSEPHATEAAATAREAQLKRWSGQKKRALIAGSSAALHNLSRRRTG